MSVQPSPARRVWEAWLDFWFGLPAPHANLALIRIGTALMLLYVLFLRSFDITTRFTVAGGADPAALGAFDPVAWPFSVFTWVDAAWWVWSMHVLALLVAAALLLGVVSPLAAALGLVFQLSYVHQNPAMLVSLDGLLILALAYLALAPSGQVLGLLPLRGRPPPARMSYDPYRVWERPEVSTVWATFPLRLLQLHLCVLYVHSALGRLVGDWLAGTAFWHPRLVELGTPFSLETLLAVPWLTSVITFGLVLFELLYPVLVWLPRLRYPLLALAVVVHLTVGWAWGLMPFNLLMIVLNAAFIPRAHLSALLERLRPFLLPPWLAGE